MAKRSQDANTAWVPGVPVSRAAADLLIADAGAAEVGVQIAIVHPGCAIARIGQHRGVGGPCGFYERASIHKRAVGGPREVGVFNPFGGGRKGS